MDLMSSKVPGLVPEHRDRQPSFRARHLVYLFIENFHKEAYIRAIIYMHSCTCTNVLCQQKSLENSKCTMGNLLNLYLEQRCRRQYYIINKPAHWATFFQFTQQI